MISELKTFLENYNIKVLNSHNTYRRIRYIPNAWKNAVSDDPITCSEQHDVSSEALLTISVPESRLEALANIERKFFGKHTHSSREVDLFSEMTTAMESEEYFRNTNPAVSIAYNQYQILLALAGHKSNHLLTSR